MNTYGTVVYPFLHRIDAETAHDQTLRALTLAQRTAVGRTLLRQLAGRIPQRPVVCAGLSFPNILGLAAGFDKDGQAVEGLSLLGFGHIEVGTLTPRPQVGNPRPRIFRLKDDGALINRMGFPNGGAEAAVAGLNAISARPRSYILGVSLGKQKETELGDAGGDYLSVMRSILPYCDYMAVNVSSPNTPGLRELQGRRYLEELLTGLMRTSRDLARQHNLKTRPIFVKIAPDLSWAELDELLAAVETSGVDGIIATNTTLERKALQSQNCNEAGGLSGAPLRSHSNEIIRYVNDQTSGRLPVIGVGGVSSAADVCAKIDAGATLVQLYTGLVYGGPGLPGRLLREMEQTPCAGVG